MKSCDELKAKIKSMRQQIVEPKKNEHTNALKEVKRPCKEFGFITGMLKDSLTESEKKL